MTPDIIISVRFLTTAECGRETPVQGQSYSCPLFIGDDGFDCRLLLDGRRLDLGENHEVAVKFLYREKALPKMKTGAELHLWEGRNIASGEIIQVCENI